MFCPKCKSIMKPEKKEGKVVLVCPSCGASAEPEKSHVIRDAKEKRLDKKFGVADEKNILAVHKHTCPKCGYDKAELIEQGVWYTDEDHVVLYKCGRCGHTEREEAKIK